MAKKLTKLELVTALTAAGVPVSPSATVTQLRSLYDAEGIVENGVVTVENEVTADVDVDEDAAISKLEKKRKFLLLQKEVRALENEMSEGIQSLSVGDIDNMVPKFSGDNAYSIEKWLTDFENAMKICKTNSHLKYMSARRLLSGTAGVFLRTSTAANFDELKAELLQHFKRHVSVNDVYKELYSRQRLPSENILAYMFAMREIAAQAKLKDIEVIEAIIEGLRDKSAHISILYTAKTMEELKDLLLIYEKRRPKINMAERVAKSTLEVRCYNCSKSGHISSQCTQPKRVTGACFRCNVSGHQIKDCPKKSNAIVHVVQQDDNVQPIDVNQKWQPY